jgi:sensor histidine kinase YesM
MLIGLSFGAYLYLTYDHRLVRVFISVLSSVCIGSLMMLAIGFRAYVIRITGHPVLKVIIMIVLLVAAALSGTGLTLLLQGMPLFRGGSIYGLNVLIVLVVGIPIYVSEESKNVLNARLAAQQYRVLQLEQQQTAFELEVLRAKVNPHFLYNVHNTIAGLISKDPVKAEEMVLLLSKFFRETLSKTGTAFHAVSDELDIVTTYLNLQRIRYEDRMTYTIEADAAALNLPLPSFVLQPLVENAVKHGIELSLERGHIRVEIKLDAHHLQILIADTGPEFPDNPGGGHGLSMVMSKLNLLYGDTFILELTNTPQKYVRLIIPRRDQDLIG